MGAQVDCNPPSATRRPQHNPDVEGSPALAGRKKIPKKSQKAVGAVFGGVDNKDEIGFEHSGHMILEGTANEFVTTRFTDQLAPFARGCVRLSWPAPLVAPRFGFAEHCLGPSTRHCPFSR